MYEEELLKLNTMKELIKNSLLKKGVYAEKKYIETLLKDIDTRYAILNYKNVQSGDMLDIEKFNNDLLKIKKDFEILYQIINKISKEKFIELQARVNSYLLSLEEVVERAEKESEYQFSTTSIGGDIIYYVDKIPSHTKQDTTITINLNNINCHKNSKLLCFISGMGFVQENVEFKIGDQTVLPYMVNREYIKTDNELSKNSYVVNIDNNVKDTTSYILLNSNVNTDSRYEVYGGKNKIFTVDNTGVFLTEYQIEKEIWTGESNTDFSFYTLNGGFIDFEFSTEPISKNFYETSIKNIDKNALLNFSFTMPPGSCFKIKTDCTLYAKKESVAIDNQKLYLASLTPARDFLVYEYKSDIMSSEYTSGTATIYNVNYENFHIGSIAIKEIKNYNGENN